MDYRITTISGRRITRQEAFAGLGDPKTWASDKAASLRQFRKKPKGPSSLEQDFLIRWSTVKGAPTLVAEFVFHPVRKWRFDFACPAARVAIELEGGTFGWVDPLNPGERQVGGHSTGKGYEKDCLKYNEAIMAGGWFIFRLTRNMLQGKNGGFETLKRMADFMQSRIGMI